MCAPVTGVAIFQRLAIPCIRQLSSRFWNRLELIREKTVRCITTHSLPQGVTITVAGFTLSAPYTKPAISRRSQCQILSTRGWLRAARLRSTRCRASHLSRSSFTHPRYHGCSTSPRQCRWHLTSQSSGRLPAARVAPIIGDSPGFNSPVPHQESC